MLDIEVPEKPSAPTFKSAHFIGIGGAGMSGIALVLHERGVAVTGSDLKRSRYVRELLRAGIDVRIGHDAQNIDELQPDVVVVSSAIRDTNPELVRARELGIPVWHRAKMLSALSYGYTTVAVAGTHGKTTTSSMTATMLDRMGEDPSFLIGGTVEGYGTNGRNGSGPYFVAEADESDSSFLFLDPHIVVVTNIEEDHMDHYGSLEEIEETFCVFMGLVGEDGTVIVCGEDPHLPELARSTGRRVLSYGFGPGNDTVCIPGPDTHTIGSTCTVRLPDGSEHEVAIHNNPGPHNQLNASAALTVAYALGLDTSAAAEALSTFEGVRRRFTHVGDVNGIPIIDDFGHHPTEISATIKAAKDLDYDRVVVVHQPHRYTRLQALCDQFADAFGDADELLLIDVFSAGEDPIPGVTSKMLADAILEKHPDAHVRYVPNRAVLMDVLDETLRPGDLLMTLGAGDVASVGPQYLEHVASMQH